MLTLLPFLGLRFLMRKNSEDQIQSAKKLRLKYIHISNGMIRTGDIAAELFQSEVLTEKERDDIQHLLSTPVRANEQLLNTLMFKDTRAFECFLAALSNTKQTHIAEFLKCDGRYLDTKHSLMIQRNYMALIDNLDVDGGLLLDRLFKDGLITDREVETIHAKLTKHEKNETLLALVSKFSVDNFDKFLQALEESSQEHVVSILTGKYYPKSESTKVESKFQCKHSKLREELQPNQKVQQNSNQNLRNNRQIKILHSTEGIEAPSFHVIRKSIITFGSRFTQLPDELQTELATKVAALRQKTVRTNVDICYFKLLQGKEVNRNQTEFEDINETLRRVNESVEKTALIFKDDLKTEMLNEELEWHRSNIRHLDEALKISVIDLSNERQKSIGFELQFAQHQKEKEEMKKDRDELRMSLHMSMKCIDDFKKQHEKYQKDSEDLRKEKNELEISELVSKSRIDDLIDEIQRYQKKTEDLQKEKDELERSELVSKSRIDDLIGEIQRYQKETEELLKERDGFQNSMGESKQRIGDLITQIEQYQNETMHFQKQRDELQKQLDEARVLIEANRKRYEAPLLEKEKIRTVRPCDDESKAIWGVARVGNELYILRDSILSAELWLLKEQSIEYLWKLHGRPLDMAGDSKNQYLYILCCNQSDNEILISVYDINESNCGPVNEKPKHIWSDRFGGYVTLSITTESNVLLTLMEDRKLVEYIYNGEIQKVYRKIEINNMVNALHAVKQSEDRYVVCQGENHDDTYRVCILNASGHLLKEFCLTTYSGLGKSVVPMHLGLGRDGSIIVAENRTARVLQLSNDLTVVNVLLTAKDGLRGPCRLHLDEAIGQLIVADNEHGWRAGKLLFYDI